MPPLPSQGLSPAVVALLDQAVVTAQAVREKKMAALQMENAELGDSGASRRAELAYLDAKARLVVQEDQLLAAANAVREEGERAS